MINDHWTSSITKRWKSHNAEVTSQQSCLDILTFQEDQRKKEKRKKYTLDEGVKKLNLKLTLK